MKLFPHSIQVLVFLSAVTCFAASPERFWPKVRSLVPQVSSWTEGGKSGLYELRGADGAALGQLLTENYPAEERPTGFGGKVEVAMILDAEGKVCGVLVGENQETPQFLDRVEAAGLLAKWNGLTLTEANQAQVSPVSGATYSSRAIARGVRQLSASYLEEGMNTAISSVSRKELEEELAQLEARIATESFILARSTILLDQRQNRRAEELEFREIVATQGRTAANAYAEEHKMLVSGHFWMTFAASELAKLGKAYQANPTDEALAAVRAEAIRDLDSALAGLLPHNVAHANSILAAQGRVQEIKEALETAK